MLSPGTLDHTKRQRQGNVGTNTACDATTGLHDLSSCGAATSRNLHICQSMPSPYVGLDNCAVLLFAVALASMGFAKQVHLWYSFLIFTCT